VQHAWGRGSPVRFGEVGNAGAIAGDELAVEDGRLGGQVAQQVGDVSKARREVVTVAAEDRDVVADCPSSNALRQS
jgi:hypothetical protein